MSDKQDTQLKAVENDGLRKKKKIWWLVHDLGKLKENIKTVKKNHKRKTNMKS